MPTADIRFQFDPDPAAVIGLLLFVLFVFALMLFGCSKPEDEAMTARFFCLSDSTCQVWYGVYDTDMRREATDECWQQVMEIEPGSTLMLNCETGNAPATLLLSVYEGDDCIAFGQASVEANSGGEILINY